MTECTKLMNNVKTNSITNIFEWINLNCDCNICSKYNVLFNLMENNYHKILENKHFKKINLTDKMKFRINKELQKKILIQKIFKKI